ncbi:alpha-ketoacid dehydrogenase subunit beta [Coxiella endosymbiont of Rhipicephalus microplus]|uniref:alpha-ketoacid dehydrogenase subunit beta n=1 Tax=Coxiella endosymbiont of Rhipicephalus microplus TaxID=1656186 RepID=UPI000CE5B91C|nr:alpha-ketoacid dehydrogenase subunit beta [Coxiella endosymbiont of Rhipicephalus microplus]
MTYITLLEAVNQALAYEMTQDDSVILLGEDVGINGGVFRATVGLVEKFGLERVLDTPLSESMIAGISIGMAAQGLKPVAEFQFLGFIYSALDHILSHAARLRNRTRGRLHCPIVYRSPFGGGIHAPEHHSESMEALFAHIPGLRVVIPSSPSRAYGLLLASIRNPDPVLFLEPKRIYRLVRQEVPDDGKALPLDKCFILREGSDVTLITWGAMIKETMEAANQLAQQSIQAEIIDVATIKPLDMDTILHSVEKTGRCVIIHEAPLTGGVGAEIAAGIAEQGLLSLLAPIKRVAGYDTIMPYFQLEKKYIPSTHRIVKAVKPLMEFS